MKTIQFVPGAVVSPAAITIPTAAERMVSVVSAYILRGSSLFSISSHAGGAVDAHAGGAVDAHAGTAVDAHAGTAVADHAVHGHNITMAVAAGGGGAVTAPVIPGPLESAAGVATMLGAVDVLAAAQVHAVTQPNAHAVTQPNAHAFTQPNAHAFTQPGDHTLTGTSAVVACIPTWLTEATLSLNVNTVLGDVLSLTYVETGSVLQID